MSRLMLLLGNSVALLGSWFADLSVGDALMVLGFELVISVYLLWPLVRTHLNGSRRRGHFQLVMYDSGTEHASGLTYTPLNFLGHTFVLLLLIFGGTAWWVQEWQPQSRLLTVAGLSLVTSIAGFLIEKQAAPRQSFGWIREQYLAVLVRMPGLIVITPIAWFFAELGLVCIVVMVVVKTAVEFGLLGVLARVRANQGAALGAGLSSTAKRELKQWSAQASASVAREEEVLEVATFERLRKEAFGNMGITL